MSKKQFKAESKKLLDLMINSIYTHKEIFLRELISNASDALDKLYFRSLTDNSVLLNREDFEIQIAIDKVARTITISDNGCGMTSVELESNLGTIAKSGSLSFKQENEKQEGIDIIGQFGVGFYSAFMVSDDVTVVSRPFGSNEAFSWESNGAEGYTISPCTKDSVGTTITLHIKENTENENYDEYLENYRVTSIVKKYSDFVRYPIKMDVSTQKLKEGSKDEYDTVVETKTLNSMVPLWKKDKKDITKEEYDSFYRDQFNDYEACAKEIHYKVEGQATYTSLLYIPKHAPFDYYSKEFEKGLQLYSSGILIMDKCSDLLPDYFSFVRGLVDSEDLSLNISRETLQHDRQLKIIASNLEKKIKSELLKLLKDDRETYEEFYNAFGTNLKFGVYNGYGANRDVIEDLLMFTSSFDKKLTTLDEYLDRAKEGQETIYYACGETPDKIDMLPQTEQIKESGFEILYLTENVDEFAVQMLVHHKDKKFVNICAEKLDLSSDDDKAALKKSNEEASDMFSVMQEALGGSVQAVRFTNRLKNHPVCLVSEGDVSLEMEKVLKSMPTASGVKAQLALEINKDHPIAQKLKDLFESDKELLKSYASLLYSQARLIEGMSIDNPTELSRIICDLMIK